LSQLFVGKDADYEDDLITAARWSHTPEERAIAVNNLGTFNWMKLGRSMSRKNIPQYGARFMRRDLLHFSRTMGIKPADGEETGRLSDKELSLLQEALSFWGEAVKECVTDSYSDTNAKQVSMFNQQHSLSYFYSLLYASFFKLFVGMISTPCFP
jgi:hypothetical protein